MQEPVLAVLDLNKKIRIKVNASDYTMEGVLLMEEKNRKQKLVIFLSKFLNEIKRNYEIHNKKMLVIIRGLKSQKHLLKGTQFKFEI